MIKLSIKNKILATTILALPSAFISVTPVHAACSITSGGGTVAIPTNGSVINCPSNETTTTKIGDGTTDATITLENGHILDRKPGGNAIRLNNTTVTLGDNAQIEAANHGIYATQTATVILGKNATIVSNAYGVWGKDSANVTLGEGASITSSLPVIAWTGTTPSVVVTMGKNSQLTSTFYGGIYATDTLTLVMGENTKITSNTYGVYSNTSTITLGKNAQIISPTREAIIGTTDLTMAEGSSILGNRVSTGTVASANSLTMAINSSITNTANVSTSVRGTSASNIFDIAGTISGTNNSVSLLNGDDTLILRTGANLVGAAAGGIGGTDTVILYGSNTEEANFDQFESLQMNGADWTLSGTSNFGTADINSGILRNNGAIAANVNVNSGAEFGGTGTTIGNVTNDGSVAPGASIGTQSITGNYVQNSGGDLIIEFDSTSSDLLDITGSATLDGRVTFSEFAGGTADGTTYTFLQTTGGITGSFATINNPLFFNVDVAVGANNATFTLNRIQTITTAQTTSESALAGALDSVLASNPSSIAEIDSILNSFTSDQAASDFFASQSSIVTGSAINSVSNAIGLINPVISSRFVSPSSQNSGSPSHVADISPAAGGDDNGNKIVTPLKKPKKTSWVEAVGGVGSIDADSVSRGANFKQYGITAGLEYVPTNKTNIGLFGAYSKVLGKIDRIDDKNRTNIYQGGIYGSKKIDNNFRIGGSISTAFIDFQTSRNTVNGNAKADFYGFGGYVQSNIAYDIATSRGWLSPSIGFESGTTYNQGYNETGAGVLNLSVSDQFTNQLASVIGVESRVNNTGLFKELSPYTVSSLAGIAWGHEFLDRSTTSNVNFASAPSINFTSKAIDKSRDYIKLKLDLSTGHHDNDKALGYIRYDGKLSSDTANHALTMGLRFRW